MSRFRVFVLSLWVTCVCTGVVNGQEGERETGALVQEPQETPVVLGGVKICGPIYEALVFLGPKDESGKLDAEWLAFLPHPSGLQSVFFPPQSKRATEFAGHAPSNVLLGEFKGGAQRIVETWAVDGEALHSIWSEMSEELRSLKGEPAEKDPGFAMWFEGDLRTIIILDEEAGTAEVHYECGPHVEEFWARVHSVPKDEEPPEPTHVSNEFRPSERVLGGPLLNVLGANGEPEGGPYHRGTGAIGLYYEGIDFLGIPCNVWFWFVEGEMVYRGAEFAPPLGPSRAMEAFWGFSKPLSGWYGEPFITIGGEGFDRTEHHWLNGNEETILRLETADDPPWFRFEVIDRDRIHSIEGDLRPDRKPIPRYVPPQKDSGKTRGDLVVGDARG